MSWRIEIFDDENGKAPFSTWVRRLEPAKRATVVAAVERQLGVLGPDVCRTEAGKALGGGLYEFRIRHDEGIVLGKTGVEKGAKTGRRILLRVFFHVHGDRIVLLLGGYDKGKDPGHRRQRREIEKARRALKLFKQARRNHGSR